MPESHAGWWSLSSFARKNREKLPCRIETSPYWLCASTDVKEANFCRKRQPFAISANTFPFLKIYTCIHATNGGKQRVLLLSKAFRFSCSSFFILSLSALGFWVSISRSMPANRELNKCLATTGSLWRKMSRKIINFSQFLACYFHSQYNWQQSYLGKGLKGSDEATVWNLNVRKVSRSVVPIESHLSLFL